VTIVGGEGRSGGLVGCGVRPAGTVMNYVRRLVLARLTKVLHRFGYVVVPKRRLPHGDVVAFCANAAARGFAPSRIFDVGANRGDWSRGVRDVFPDAQYTLIEPQIEMAADLDAFCAQTPGARWINAGAGARNGELSLTIAHNPASSSFAITEEHAVAWGLKQRSVPIVTLDSVCEQIGAIPELVKLDVEGFEREVLEGARSLIGVTEVFLLELTMFEPHTGAMTFAESVALMSSLGYHAYDFTMFAGRPYDGAVGLCEVAFVRDGGVLRAHRGWR
jgi:FkbM family methyltransferase